MDWTKDKYENIDSHGDLDDYGFDVFGIHFLTGEKYDPHGFDEYGIHHITKTEYSPEGYDCMGYDKDGWFLPIYEKTEFKFREKMRTNALLIQPTLDDCNKYDKSFPDCASFLELKYKYDWFDKVFEANGKKGLKDVKGNVLIPPLYEGFSELYEYPNYRSWPIPACNSDGKYGLVKKDGSGIPVTEFEYDSIEIVPSIGWYIVSKNGYKGLLSEQGKVLLQCRYDDFIFFWNIDITIVCLNGKYGFLKYNSLYVEPIFDEISRLQKSDGKYLVYVHWGGKRGFVDIEGNFIAENQCYDDSQLVYYDNMPCDDMEDSVDDIVNDEETIRNSKKDNLILFQENVVKDQQNEDLSQIFEDDRFQDAFKIPQYDKEGYSKSLPAIWSNYGFGRHDNGVLYLTLKSAHVLSRLYSRYLDVRSIVYDNVNKRLFIYEPDESCPEMAFKGSAWERAVVLKPEYEGSITLEECYFELLGKLGNILSDEWKV